MIHPRPTPPTLKFSQVHPRLWRSLQAAGLTVIVGGISGVLSVPGPKGFGELSLGAVAWAQEEGTAPQGSEPVFPNIPREGQEQEFNGDPDGSSSDGSSGEALETTPQPAPSPAPKQPVPSPDPEVTPESSPEPEQTLERSPAPRSTGPTQKRPKPDADPFSPLIPQNPDAIIPDRDSGPLAGEEDPPPNVPPELLSPVDPWRAYRLAPLDQVVVQVFGYPDLSFANGVDQGGRILVPLVGFLKVEGLTLEELQDVLTAAYNDYVVDPEVLVTLGSQVNPDIVVAGEVIRPGFYRVGSFETVVQALISAGGVKDSADLRAIALRRRLPDGSLLEQELNLLGLLANGLPEPRLFLQDGDVVFVPRREVVNDPTYDFALATLNNLGSPTIRVRLLNYIGGSGRLQTITLPAGSSFIDALNGLPFTEVNIRKLALIRFEPEQGEVVTQEFDGRAAIMGDLSQNPQLRDNDVIVANPTLIARITSFFNRFTQPFRDVLGFVLFFDQLGESATNLFSPDEDDNNDN